MGIIEILLLPLVLLGWLFSTLFGALYTLLWLLSSIWAFFDARNRDRSGCLVFLLVFFLLWPLGLILWIVLRPPRR